MHTIYSNLAVDTDTSRLRDAETVCRCRVNWLCYVHCRVAETGTTSILHAVEFRIPRMCAFISDNVGKLTIELS